MGREEKKSQGGRKSTLLLTTLPRCHGREWRFIERCLLERKLIMPWRRLFLLHLNWVVWSLLVLIL